MKHHHLLRRGLLALALGLAALPIRADDDCDAPVARWQSREAVRKMAAGRGWNIQQLKIDDGCYEIRGTDTQGRAFKARIDPETLKVLKLKQRDRKHARDDERERDPAAPPNRLPPADGAVAPPPLFIPGTAPRGQID